jgi:hypothetical protein
MVGSTSVLKAIPQDILNRLWTAKETRVSVGFLSLTPLDDGLLTHSLVIFFPVEAFVHSRKTSE